MNEPLMDAAYTFARQHYEAASLAVFKSLDSQFSGTAFDTVHHTAQRAIRLYFSALGFAQKVWAGSLSYEKAQEMLQTQFSDFPASTCQRALGDAYTETR